jgi:hypothetical protein
LEAIVTILIIIGVIAVAALLFGGWLIVSVVKLLASLLAGIARVATGDHGRRRAVAAGGPHAARCAHARCRALNDHPQEIAARRSCATRPAALQFRIGPRPVEVSRA